MEKKAINLTTQEIHALVEPATLEEDFDLGLHFTRDITVIATILILLLAGIYGFFINQRAATIGEEQAQEVMEWIASQEAVITKYKTEIEAYPEILEDTEALVSYLYQSSEGYNAIAVAFVCAHQYEQQMYSSDGWIPDEDYDLAEKDYYGNALASDGVYITDVYMDVVTNQLCITMSVALEVDGYDAIVGADIYLDDLVELMESTYQGSQYATLLVADTVVTDPYAAFAMSAEQSVAKEDTIYRNVEKSTFLVEGGFSIANRTAIEGTDWEIISVYTLDSIILIFIGMITIIGLIASMMDF